ncbi:Cleavage and polyadenylation specificity factor subunit 2 [Glycine soja]|uniref:Cleavage and polyadenylation specificity factor subunit 2 n=1 Tax=Glycine soja TaxID=3848 RepID=A0A445I462_GLYSO|nr:Cleavage and polyadenylation specificity factor subunit 2 [Glycine soja]
MGTSVRVTPLCGVYNENPLSYLVSIDGFNFLVDCGWNDHFDPSHLQPLARVASTIDAVLLSHADTLHLGALPYAMKRLGLSAPVYSTEPIYILGLLTMMLNISSSSQVSGFDLFTLDDIDSAFQSVTRITYSQNHHFSGKGEGIVIAPHVAGHLLGGTIWKITKDGEDVIYAVDFNHRKERHLNGTVLGSFVRPAVLITDAYNALNNQPYRRQNDKEFGDCYACTCWYVTLLINKTELDNAPDGPKVVLASMASLEAGFSHDIFVEWANDVKNLVLFTERGQFATLARMLQADPPPKAVKVVVSKCVPLVGKS